MARSKVRGRLRGSVRLSDAGHFFLFFLSAFSDQIKRYGVFPEQVTFLYSYQILLALDYVHTRRIIHGDVKTSNVLITKDGVVKLTDFGVAVTSSRDGMLGAGSPFFMAPEVVEGAGLCITSDIWSLGCCVVELLQGQPPYSDLGEVNSLFRLLKDPHPPLPSNSSDKVWSC